MPCYQVICVNDFDAIGRYNADEVWDITVASNPIFATLEGAQNFCHDDAMEWQAQQNEDRDPDEDHFAVKQVEWEETKPGEWTGTLNDSNIETTDWSAYITLCRFLDTEGIA